MAWDLRGALLKKEERESSRLADFEFKRRVRTLRLLARKFSLDEKSIVALIAKGNDEEALDAITSAHRIDRSTLKMTFTHCAEKARKQLIGELGSPEPYRLL